MVKPETVTFSTRMKSPASSARRCLTSASVIICAPSWAWACTDVANVAATIIHRIASFSREGRRNRATAMSRQGQGDQTRSVTLASEAKARNPSQGTALFEGFRSGAAGAARPNDGPSVSSGVSLQTAMAAPVSLRRDLRYEPRNRWLRLAPIADILRRHSDSAP